LPVEAAVGAMVVVEVLPLLELVVKDVGIVDDHAVKEPVELFGVDAVRALDLPVEPRCAGLDVDVTDALVERMPVECGAELCPVAVWMTSSLNGSRCAT
jgi:hypothetical protein